MLTSRPRTPWSVLVGLLACALLVAPLALSASLPAQLVAGCAALLVTMGFVAAGVSAVGARLDQRARNAVFARSRQQAAVVLTECPRAAESLIGYRFMTSPAPPAPMVPAIRVRPWRWALWSCGVSGLVAPLLWLSVPATVAPAALTLGFGVGCALAIMAVARLAPEVRALSPEVRIRQRVELQNAVEDHDCPTVDEGSGLDDAPSGLGNELRR